jgi:hypothetical protein
MKTREAMRLEDKSYLMRLGEQVSLSLTSLCLTYSVLHRCKGLSGGPGEVYQRLQEPESL